MSSAYPSLALSSSSTSIHRSVSNLSSARRRAALSRVHESDTISSNRSTPQIVLIHDPPILFTHSRGNNSSGGSQQEVAIDSELLGRIILSFDVPVVIVLSDLAGKEEVNFAVDKCIAHTYRQQ